eukprot:TRINITY_DN9749_c0_g1_i1.p1 TRINITY_DN9749_c0_g1~~TRINITY_DN9749_c0_g1_i1.p1  ORF type:complete len:228 (-),score=31.36 TRINITY_DN9749_c0_g1_i1:18-701(-)
MNRHAFLIATIIILVCAVNVKKCPPGIGPEGDWSATTKLGLFHLANEPSTTAKQQTTVHICYTEVALHIKFDCIDNNASSTFHTCNQPLYQQDVVETFITSRYNAPNVDLHHYVEIEVSPNGVLFVSDITNPNLVCSGITGDTIDCSNSGITWEAKKFSESWWAYLSVPWKLIDRGNPVSTHHSFSANFFRIDTPLSSAKEYSCWNSTDSRPPCFHKPHYFGVFNML